MIISGEQRNTILIVDDNRAFRLALARFLSGEGYEVLLAEDATEGLELVRIHQPCVVIMDVNMPDLDGFDAVRKIREFSSVPILILSVRGSEMDRCLGAAAGANSYLAKPFSASELLTQIDGLVNPTLAARPVTPAGSELW
jgi:DNA-binding response OmpR family regulator